MWQNYLMVGLRALVKNKTYAFINIFGLAVGLAACLMILLYVRYETSYDSWIADAERVYQVQAVATDPETGAVAREQMSAFPVGLALAKDFAEIEAVSRAVPTSMVVLRDGEPIDADLMLVDEPFFDMLALPFVGGDPANALDDMDSVVLTETEALRYFGSTDVVGKTLTVMRRGEKADRRVTGVLADLPTNTHLKLGLVTRFNPADFADYVDAWGIIGGYNYVKLRRGAEPDAIHARMQEWEKRNIPTETLGNVRSSPGDNRDWYLTRISDVHLGEAQDNAMTPGNDRRTIVTFVIVALLILAMACVNFTNLTTARASQRAREVALRKVLGAHRAHLIVQFLGESILLTALAMLLALAMVEITLPLFSAFLESELRLDYFGPGGIILPAAALLLIVGGVGGLYPAFYLSGFRPARILKANKAAAESTGSGRLRNLLVIAQFAVSIGLIICTTIIYLQASHARTSDFGYQREGLLQIQNINRTQVEPLQEALVAELRQLEGVISASRTSETIGLGGNIISVSALVPGRREPTLIEHYSVDPAFVETMGIRLLAGRNFSGSRAADDATFPKETDLTFEQSLARRGMNVIINDLASKQLGFASPRDAVGKRIGLSLVSDQFGPVPTTIVGVFSDVRLRTVRAPVEPTLYRVDESAFDKLIIRYKGDPGAVRDRIQSVWKRLFPQVPFEAAFADDIVAELYAAESRRAWSFAGFAGLAIIIACLGLFGLAAFTAERRTKEIGIRKVFGARVRDIVRLLVWQFSKPVVIANLIAWPAAWWVMRDWLNTFDARIALTPTPFLLAGLIALAIAIGTIASHAIRVARTSPIHALRYE
jgi:putative ABC transport system permease protein